MFQLKVSVENIWVDWTICVNDFIITYQLKCNAKCLPLFKFTGKVRPVAAHTNSVVNEWRCIYDYVLPRHLRQNLWHSEEYFISLEHDMRFEIGMKIVDRLDYCMNIVRNSCWIVMLCMQYFVGWLKLAEVKYNEPHHLDLRKPLVHNLSPEHIFRESHVRNPIQLPHLLFLECYIW